MAARVRPPTAYSTCRKHPSLCALLQLVRKSGAPGVPRSVGFSFTIFDDPGGSLQRGLAEEQEVTRAQVDH